LAGVFDELEAQLKRREAVKASVVSGLGLAVANEVTLGRAPVPSAKRNVPDWAVTQPEPILLKGATLSPDGSTFVESDWAWDSDGKGNKTGKRIGTWAWVVVGTLFVSTFDWDVEFAREEARERLMRYVHQGLRTQFPAQNEYDKMTNPTAAWRAGKDGKDEGWANLPSLSDPLV
jgi:hypothetical protein